MPASGSSSKNEMRLGRQRPGDLAASALAAGKRHRRRPPQMRDRELGHQRIEHRLAHFRRGLGDLENRADILLDGKPAKDRGLLRQIADAEASAAIHRQIGDVAPIEADNPGIGGDQPGDDVKAGRLAGAVGPEQTDHLAALHRDVDVAQHRPPLEALAEPVPEQAAVVGDEPRPPTVGGRVLGASSRTASRSRLLRAAARVGRRRRCRLPVPGERRGPRRALVRHPGLPAAGIMRLTLLFRSTTAY